MTLFTLLLTLAWERLFKQGEHWQIDHRLEVVFRHVPSPSLLQTLFLTLCSMGVVAGLLWLTSGILFGLISLLLWIIISLMCIGAGEIRQHYRRYLQAAQRGEADASREMAAELALIHGLPVGTGERQKPSP